MNAVLLKGLRKAYGDRTVLSLDELALPEGEFFVLVGPSGSGKTTLLRIVAGLVRPDAGTVQLDGADATRLQPHNRRIGFVFQGLALWPHLTVRGNVALGLRRLVPDAAERRARIDATARELGIEPMLDRKPALLSGGERQRVALARALVRQPALLLLDEPFSDLDARLRRVTARLVRDLHDRHGMTTLLITHDRTDAHLLADRIGVMRAGRLVACGPPGELHAAPGNAFAAEFLTDAALLAGTATDTTVETVLGQLPLASPANGAIRVAVRPDEIRVGEGPARGRVVACEFAGGAWRCRIVVGDHAELLALHDQPLRPGEEVALTPPATARQVLALEDDA
ncbi:MAG: ABC transporter ATP-binding protein [Planctomycetota bacterium]|jgi:ABC-type Fe3+/spermidine/putrescine transport system ATPase subunit